MRCFKCSAITSFFASRYIAKTIPKRTSNITAAKEVAAPHVTVRIWCPSSRNKDVTSLISNSESMAHSGRMILYFAAMRAASLHHNSIFSTQIGIFRTNSISHPEEKSNSLPFRKLCKHFSEGVFFFRYQLEKVFRVWYNRCISDFSGKFRHTILHEYSTGRRTIFIKNAIAPPIKNGVNSAKILPIKLITASKLTSVHVNTISSIYLRFILPF